MATVHHHHIPLPIQPANHRRRRAYLENVSTTTAGGESMARLGGWALAMTGRPLASVTSIAAPRRFQGRSRPFCAAGNRSPEPTAEGSRGEVGGAAGDGGKAEAVTNLPSPPEGPLPGDCCGCGCVRCVWDVYHEELQAYRDLLAKAKPEL